MITLAETSTLQVILWIGIMIGAVFIATVAIMIFRKKVLNTDGVKSGALLMDDFRRLHASGKLSDHEFQSLRTQMATKMKSATVVKAASDDTTPRAVPRAPQRQTANPPASKVPPRRPQPPSNPA